MAIELFRYIGGALLLLFFQFYFIDQINFATWVKPMPYIYLIFIFPFSFNKYVVLLASFAAGMLLDITGNSYGMHAAACTALAFARIHTDKLLVDQDAIQLQGYRNVQPGFKGWTYYGIYILGLTFLHHLVFFSLDYFKFSSFFLIIGVSFLSSFVTFALMMLYRVIISDK